jgi:hypothetical protein
MLIISHSQFPDVNEETKMLIKEWGKVITNKYKDIEKDYNLNEEMFCNEPLLVIDYDQFGLERRKITDSHVAKSMFVNYHINFCSGFSNFFVVFFFFFESSNHNYSRIYR